MRSWRRVPLPPPVSRSASRSRRARRRRNGPPARPGRRRSCSTWACGPTRRRSRCGAPTNLYNAGKRGQAAAIFGRYGSLEAQVGTALAAWPSGFGSLAALAKAHPRSAARAAELRPRPLLARRDPGREGRLAQTPAGASPTRRTRSAPRTCSTRTSRAGCRPSCRASRLPPPSTGCRRRGSSRYLQRLAETGGARGKLLYGVALQRLGRQLSALREFEAAAALAPGDPEPQVAAAVGRFDKADPVAHLLPARPAGAALSEEPERALPSRPLPALARQRDEGPRGAPARPRPRAASTPLGTEARRFLAQLSRIKTALTRR